MSDGPLSFPAHGYPPVAYLCRHTDPPQTIRPGYQCDGDEPIHDGDTVVVETLHRIVGERGEAIRSRSSTTVTVRRRAEELL